MDLQAIWLKGAYAVAGAYMLFAFALIGVPGLSVFAAPMVFVMIAWIAWGVTAGLVMLPRVLLFPAAYFVFMVIVALFDKEFPGNYLGRMFTIWVGGISFAVLVANGVKIRHVFDAFMVIALVNLIAIWVGYDGYLQNVAEEVVNLEESELARYSGLAGQSNTLSSIALMPLFLLLLQDRLVSLLKFGVLIAGALLITYYTGSRNALVLTAAFAVVSALFLMSGNRQRLFVLLLSLPVLIGWTLIVKSDTIRNMVEKSPVGAVTVVKRLIDQSDGVEGSSEARRIYVQMAWQHWPASPIVGHGSEHFTKISPHQTYSHNNYVELLVNYGALGFLIYYALYFRVLLGHKGQHVFDRLRISTIVAMLLVADTWDVNFVTRVPILILCITLVIAAREIKPDVPD